MRKLRLDLEMVEVESFVIGAEEGSGTVKGHDSMDTCACPAPPPSGKTECTCPVTQCGNSCIYDTCIHEYTHPCHCL